MTKPKGGRGQTAPYNTTHVRVPEPLKEEIQQLINEWIDLVMNGLLDSNQKLADLKQVTQTRTGRLSDKTVEEAVVLVKEVLNQKKSAKLSMLKLVNELYDSNLTLKDL